MLLKTQENTLVILKKDDQTTIFHVHFVYTQALHASRNLVMEIEIVKKQTNEKSECSSFLPDSLITGSRSISTELVVIATLWETVVMCTNTDYIIKSHAKNKIMEETLLSNVGI